MKWVPYEKNHGNSCALSCYVMVGRYLWPDEDISFAKLAEIVDWREGYVVWGFKVWKWMMDKGARIVDYDVIDYDAWARDGVEGYRRSVPKENFEYVYKYTYDFEQESKNIALAFGHPNFSYVRKEVSWDDVEEEFGKPGICDVTLDAGVYRGTPEVDMHRVVLLDITKDEVIIHDPNNRGDGAYRHVPKELYVKAFGALGGAELCRYCL